MKTQDPDLRRLKAKPLPLPPPQDPYVPLKAEVSALQALERGEANAQQQKLALECIILRISNAHEYARFQRDPRDQDFGMGRAFTGQQLIGLLKINLAAFIRAENKQRE